MTDEENPYRTPAEVAAYLGVRVRTVYRIINRGDLSAIRVGGQWRIPTESISAYLKRQMRPR